MCGVSEIGVRINPLGCYGCRLAANGRSLTVSRRIGELRDLAPVRLSLRIPKLRKDSYFPDFLEPRRMAEKVLSLRAGRLHSSVDDGDGHIQEPVSPVSRLCGEIDDKVKAIAQSRATGPLCGTMRPT